MIYRNFKEWFEQAASAGVPLAKVVLENEVLLTEKTEVEIYTELAARWLVMEQSATKALEAPQKMPGGLIEGQAMRQNQYRSKGGYAGAELNEVMALAFSSSEVNASMGRICAAPTAGSCGVLPAVMLVAGRHAKASEQEMLDALLVASGVGAIIMRNATVSGAEGGCQAECGAAAAMAAAAAVVLAGGTPAMVDSAVSITLMNSMGLVCDPVAGLVQLPCSFRNASQAVSALLSADMVLAGQDSIIPADDAVDAMYRVGKKLPMELRETALGGVASSPTGKRIAEELAAQGI